MGLADIAAILLIVFTFAGMCIVLLFDAEEQKRKQIYVIRKGKVSEDSKGSTIAEQRRAELARKLKEHSKEERRKRKSGMGLGLQLECAGLRINSGQFMMRSLLLGVVLAVAMFIMHMSLLFCGVGFIVGFMGLPRLFLKFMMAKRQKEFLEDFAEALDAIVRLLKAGMPVAEAIYNVSREFKGPVAEEMSRIYDTQKIGISIQDACLESAKRMPIPEMKMFATGVSIQAQTGSSLSGVLSKISSVIRERFKLKRKVKSLSAEANSSTIILTCAPVAVFLALYFIAREHVEILYTTQTGKIVSGCALFWMALGYVVMRNMTNFKI